MNYTRMNKTQLTETINALSIENDELKQRQQVLLAITMLLLVIAVLSI
jgi:hypothetical protein